jgi:hypothetical protein
MIAARPATDVAENELLKLAAPVEVKKEKRDPENMLQLLAVSTQVGRAQHSCARQNPNLVTWHGLWATHSCLFLAVNVRRG